MRRHGDPRSGRERRQQAFAGDVDREGQVAQSGKDEIARIDQRVQIDAELLDDVALHLHDGDLEQHLLPSLHGDHVDDLAAFLAPRAWSLLLPDVLLTCRRLRRLLDCDDVASPAAWLLATKACGNLAGAGGIDGVLHGPGEHDIAVRASRP